MRSIIAGFCVCGLAVFALAGCGGSSCEDAVGNASRVFGWGGDGYATMRAQAVTKCKEEKWNDKMRSCLASAKTRGDVEGCEKHETRGGGESGQSGRRSEAEINLNAIQKSLKVHYVEMAAFPTGSAPLTPAAPCCEGPNHKCPPNASDWSSNPIWTALDFEVVEAGYYQYSYTSTDGKTATVEAVGDLDCDTTTATYTLRCEAPQGTVTCALEKPARAD